MSRWFLTSNAVMNDTASQICDKAGLVGAGIATVSGSYYLRTYRKRSIPVAENFARLNGEDMAWVAGTLLMDGKLGARSLPACYDRFLDGGISAVQHAAVGHFALGIKTGHLISIFTDGLGALSLYYCVNGPDWFISNSLSLCAEAASSQQIDPTKFLVHVLQTNLPGEDTFYTDTKRLFGMQQITIDLERHTFRVVPVPRPKDKLHWDMPTIQQALEQYTEEVRRVFGQIAAAGPVGIFGTGGLDSRTVLSALLDSGADVRMMYATGNSRLTDFDPRDLDIARQVASICNLPFEKLDWSGTQPHSDAMLADLFRKYGFQAEIYGSPQGFLNSFSGGIKPYPAIMAGGYSPALTNAKPWERGNGSVPLDTLVNDSMHFQGGDVMTSPCIKDKEAYKRAVQHGIEAALRVHAIDYPATGASLRTFVQAKLLLYVRAEARFLNLINEFGYYVAPFMDPRLYHPLLEMPYKFRTGDEFQLRLIQSLKPELVQLPLYSGIHQAKIDLTTMCFVRDVQHKPFWKRALRKVVPHGLKQALRGKKPPPPLSPDDRDATIARVYGRRVMDDPYGQQWLNGVGDFSPKDLARICQYLTGVNAVAGKQPQPDSPIDAIAP